MYDTLFNCKHLWSDCTAAAPTNGAVTSTTVVHGQATIYSCTTAGYTLIGNATQTCTSGSLSAAAPTCEQGNFLTSFNIKYSYVTFPNVENRKKIGLLLVLLQIFTLSVFHQYYSWFSRYSHTCSVDRCIHSNK